MVVFMTIVRWSREGPSRRRQAFSTRCMGKKTEFVGSRTSNGVREKR